MSGKRGRPLGYRLSEASKRAISSSKQGQRHSQETKDKISRTLTLYFRQRNPLSEEIINRYCRIDDDEICGWINSVSVDLDCCEDIKTEKNIHNIRKTEVSYGHNIELFSHELTPEVILILKEQCEELGIDVNFNDLL